MNLKGYKDLKSKSQNLHILEENLPIIDLYGFSLVWKRIECCVVELIDFYKSF